MLARFVYLDAIRQQALDVQIAEPVAKPRSFTAAASSATAGNLILLGSDAVEILLSAEVDVVADDRR